MSDGDTGPVRVLYVEDEKDLQLAVSQMLKLLGYEVAYVGDGKAGVAKAESWKPNIILMDVRMPVMDGPEAIRVLRSKPDTQNIPIFVLSAYTDSKTRLSCKDAGADGFFPKPLDIERIDTVIKETLGGK